MPDQAYADQHCADRATNQLDDIADMTPAARDIATGQAHHGGTGGGSGKPGSRLPFDLTATAKLDGCLAALTSWVDRIAAVRGTTRPWFTHHGDPLATAATWLTQHVEWMRHRPDVADFLTDVEACTRVVRGLARGPAEQRYLGPCGATLCTLCGHVETNHACEGDIPVWTCDGDVYVRGTATTGRCKTCGTEVARAEREAWLDGEVRQHAYRAAQIAEAYGVNVNTIRTWSTRPRRDTGEPPLPSYWRTAAGLVTPWTEPAITEDLADEQRAEREKEIAAELAARGPRLHYVGDVLDLAAADAAQREETRSRRARREATRAAQTEDAA
jgi:hypothetical protein